MHTHAPARASARTQAANTHGGDRSCRVVRQDERGRERRVGEGAERVREVVVDEEPLARDHERAAAADQTACGIRRTRSNAQRAARNEWMAQRGEQPRALRRAGTARHGAAWTRAG